MSALHGSSPTYKAAIVFHQDERLLPKGSVARGKAEGDFDAYVFLGFQLDDETRAFVSLDGDPEQALLETEGFDQLDEADRAARAFAGGQRVEFAELPGVIRAAAVAAFTGRESDPVEWMF